MEKRYIISPPSFFCQKKFPSQHKVWQDFDGDDDYADRCLGRQSQGGGGAALMSSCPQPKPTPEPYTCLPTILLYTIHLPTTKTIHLPATIPYPVYTCPQPTTTV